MPTTTIATYQQSYSGGTYGSPSAGQTFRTTGPISLNSFQWQGSLLAGSDYASYRVLVLAGDYTNQTVLFSSDVNFASDSNGALNYSSGTGRTYSYNFTNPINLPSAGIYALEFGYIGGQWVQGVIFSSPSDPYDQGTAYAGGQALTGDLFLSIDYTSNGGVIAISASGSTTPSSPTTPICFARGTHIQIGEQSKPVESLSISNQVSTTKASAAVKWIGYQRRTPEFAQFQDYLPVRIAAGALDNNLPLRDLYLSPDHAVLVDGHLIHAKALVNGKTIVQMTQWAGDIEYYHIETEAHEIIYAEGVPCETFIDNVSREQFDNYAEYQALYPNTRMMKELPLPRVKFKRQLPLAIKQRLESRIIELDRQHKV